MSVAALNTTVLSAAALIKHAIKSLNERRGLQCYYAERRGFQSYCDGRRGVRSYKLSLFIRSAAALTLSAAAFARTQH